MRHIIGIFNATSTNSNFVGNYTQKMVAPRYIFCETVNPELIRFAVLFFHILFPKWEALFNFYFCEVRQRTFTPLARFDRARYTNSSPGEEKKKLRTPRLRQSVIPDRGDDLKFTLVIILLSIAVEACGRASGSPTPKQRLLYSCSNSYLLMTYLFTTE